jgi:hypothetical protein
VNAETTPLDTGRLYQSYGKPFEQKHHGEYAAIAQDGRVIVDKDDVEVVRRAMEEFGSGNFIFCRIGYGYVDRLRWGTCWSARTIRICR